MKNHVLILAAAGLLMLPACTQQKGRTEGVTSNPSNLEPATSPAPQATISAVATVPPLPANAVPPMEPPRGDVSIKMTSDFKLDMPFDTAAQLKLPPKVEGDLSLDLKSKSVSSTPDRSSYSCDYGITLREVGGTRVLGRWAGSLRGEEDGVPIDVVDRAFKRLGTGVEILRRVVTPEQH